jgi:cell division protein FtsI/penicillin-binding protein 2
VRRGHVPDGWFAGLMFTPDHRPRYSVVVYLQNGGQGGRSAAPVAAMMTRWMAQQAAAEARARAAAADSGRATRGDSAVPLGRGGR